MTENNNVDGTIEKLLDRLITVIGDEAELFQHFLKMLGNQQEALIKSDVDTLQRVTSELQGIVSQSKRLEDDRVVTVDEIRRLGGADDDLTVSQICDMADESRSTQLKTLRETVLNLYSRIEETRMRNGLLIQQSVEQIRNTIEILGRVPSQKTNYKGQGGISREYTPIGVDRRV
ncbi:MAG: flagellar protein FlgN [candidate division Zixibacteria bacterium]|nr:flagellar protein FlgN [candidate division Zixibacteria bacterium]